MQVQNINNTNFKGGFRLRQIPADARLEIETVKKRGKQIFDNFEKEGDTFIVVRDELDKKVAQIVAKYNLNFEYYPFINTKSGLDNEIPEVLSALCKGYKPQTGNILELINIFSKNRNMNKAIAEHEISHKNILAALKINLNSPVRKSKKGALILADEYKTVTISPANTAGVRYIIVEPTKSTSSMEPVKRYAVRDDGVKLREFTSLDEILDFKKKFSSTLIK